MCMVTLLVGCLFLAYTFVTATGTDYSDIIDEAVSENFPEITLEWETISWNDLQGKMQQYMQSGMPDIVIGKS